MFELTKTGVREEGGFGKKECDKKLRSIILTGERNSINPIDLEN
jgi:hypothetical protein